MKHIVVDLEMNEISRKYREAKALCKMEIIEIGAVLLDENYNAQEQEVEIDNGLIREAEHEALRLALSRMNERDKELLVMKYYDELSNDEIAERNGTSEACVRANLSKARRRLRKLLEEGD